MIRFGAMNKIWSILFFVMIFLLTGCYNYTQGESNICEVHQLKMKKIIVPIHYGLPAYADCFAIYPNGGDYDLGGCDVGTIKSCVIFRCKECRVGWVKGNCSNH